MNDNGSGTSTNLELALQLYNSGLQSLNKVRFAWWGGLLIYLRSLQRLAEEMGLLGSEYYVADLKKNNPAELSNIALNLNFGSYLSL